jgi:hypothetical protein
MDAVTSAHIGGRLVIASGGQFWRQSPKLVAAVGSLFATASYGVTRHVHSIHIVPESPISDYEERWFSCDLATMEPSVARFDGKPSRLSSIRFVVMRSHRNQNTSNLLTLSLSTFSNPRFVDQTKRHIQQGGHVAVKVQFVDQSNLPFRILETSFVGFDFGRVFLS